MGEKRAKSYAKLSIHTPFDLLYHFPRGYIDYSSPIKISEAQLNTQAIIKVTITKKMDEQRIRKGLSIFNATATDFEDDITIIIYNNKYGFEVLKEGGSYLLYGNISVPTSSDSLRVWNVCSLYRWSWWR